MTIIRYFRELQCRGKLSVSETLYSVDKVAELLNLHVKTVRRHIADGLLPATRIGRQYRIAASDLEAYTGKALAPLREPSRTRRVEVSSIVEVEAIDQSEVIRLNDMLIAVANSGGEERGPLQINTHYFPEQGRLKVVIFGDLKNTAMALDLIKHRVEIQ